MQRRNVFFLIICSYMMLQEFLVTFSTSNAAGFPGAIKEHLGSKTVKRTLWYPTINHCLSVLLPPKSRPSFLFLWLSVFVHACMFGSLKQKIKKYKYSFFTHAYKALCSCVNKPESGNTHTDPSLSL